MKRRSKNDTRIRVPQIVQEALPVSRVWRDGIFYEQGVFSKSFRFNDINYSVASQKDKERIFLGYGNLLNTSEDGCRVQMTIFNHRRDKEGYAASVLLSKKDDGLDKYRSEINGMLEQCVDESNGIVQDKYYTISVPKRNIDEARAFFSRSESTLSENLQKIGSAAKPLDVTERLQVLREFYRQGEESIPFFFDRSVRLGHSFKDYLAPDSFEFKRDFFMMGDKYARVLFLRNYASFIKDSFLTELCALNRNMILSVGLLPVSTDKALKISENILLGVEKNIADFMRKQIANNNITTTAPYEMELQRKEAKEFLDDLLARDQRMFFGTLTVVHAADSYKQLQSDTETLMSIARQNMCELSILRWQQLEGLKTALPFGMCDIYADRTLTTESASVLMPFNAQEILHAGGTYLGQNATTGNPIVVNRGMLLNPSKIVTGVPGSGKSMGSKFDLVQIILNTDDDVIICDPEMEYTWLKNFGGSVVTISAGNGQYINAMDMAQGYGDSKDPLIDKSEFIMSLFEQLVGMGKLGPKEKSLIDRCVTSVYRKARKKGSVPTLPMLRDELIAQKDEEAQDLALAMELFSNGTLDIFAHETNVDMSNRVTVFDIHDLGRQLKTLGLLVVTDAMINRVTTNWQQGKRTHLIFDEFHVVFESEYSESFFTSAWRRFRKRNAHITGITQNAEYLLSSASARSLISNSECVIMYNQSENDRNELARLLHIPDTQLSFITNSQAGCGLAKIGSSIVPFRNRIPANTELYKLMTTKPEETTV